MARIGPVPRGKESWLLRMARWQTRRRFKRDLEPLEVPAHGFSEGAYCLLPERPPTKGTAKP
jgi:hypothetical protein